MRTVFKRNRTTGARSSRTSTRRSSPPSANDATRVAALLSGEVDWIEPCRSRTRAGQRQCRHRGDLLAGAAHDPTSAWTFERRAARLHNFKGKNPFKDVRVREGVLPRHRRGRDRQAGHARAGQRRRPADRAAAVPLAGDFKRPGYDPKPRQGAARRGGYPNGFEVPLDCPNDRYVNDEAICQASPRCSPASASRSTSSPTEGEVFAKILKAELRHLVLPARLDARRRQRFAQHPVRARRLPRRQDLLARTTNLGNYCNPKVDELTDKIESARPIRRPAT